MVMVKTNVTDPVADFLSRIRNASSARHEDTLVAVSNLNRALLKILEREGFIAGFTQEGDGVHRAFRVRLRYGENKEPAISGLRRISKPGRRIYARRDRLPRVLGGLGVAVISTSRGLMTDREAARHGVGGEVLAYVW